MLLKRPENAVVFCCFYYCLSGFFFFFLFYLDIAWSSVGEPLKKLSLTGFGPWGKSALWHVLQEPAQATQMCRRFLPTPGPEPPPLQ